MPPPSPMWRSRPRNGIVEIAGPERAPFNEIVVRYLKAVGDPRQVVSDSEGPDTSAAASRSARACHWEKRIGRIGLDE